MFVVVILVGWLVGLGIGMICLLCIFETGSHVAQTGLELSM